MNKLFDAILRGWETPVAIMPQADMPHEAMPPVEAHHEDDRPTAQRTIRPARVRRFSLRTGEASTVGNYRQLNEDRCYVDADSQILLIVDGMGGHRGGAEASRIIAETIPAFLRHALGEATAEEARELAREAIHAARQDIVRFAATRLGYESMGATLVLAVATCDGALLLASVGDCRAYRLRGNQFTRLTTDQTFVQAMIEAGQLTAEDAHSHPWRHVVMNALGVRELEQEIDVRVLSIADGDRLLLATDGLTDVVDDATLAQMLRRKLAPQAAAEELTELALENDSKDNVSCIVADFVASPTAAPRR